MVRSGHIFEGSSGRVAYLKNSSIMREGDPPVAKKVRPIDGTVVNLRRVSPLPWASPMCPYGNLGVWA